MKVKVHYWNQLRAARGLAEEAITLDDNATLLDLMKSLSAQDGLCDLLLDAGGVPQRWILVDRAGVMLRDPTTPLVDGDEIEMMTHMSGG